MKKERKPIPEGGIRNAFKELGVPKTLLLGLQHMFAMFGATILVPILIGNYFGMEHPPIQVTLFFAGVGTLFFHVCTKLKVPAFLGSSFAFLGGFASVANLNDGIYANMDSVEKLQYACGGVVVSGLLYLILALVMKVVGVKRVIRFLPPVVTGPMIILIGLSLAPSAVNNASTNWVLAGIALLVIVVCNIWGKGMVRIIPILLGVVIAYLAAVVFQFVFHVTNPDGSAILDFSGAAACASEGLLGFINLPEFKLAKFDLTAVFIMAPIAIATMMEHIGDISSISATVGENYVEDPGLQRTLVGDGIATAMAGMFGGPANTTYGENTGVLELSKVYDPRVIRLAAVYAIVLSFSPFVARIIGSIPSSIIGGVSFVLYGMISAVGVRNVVENQVDFRNSRNLIIAALILVTGLGFTNGLTFTVGTTSVTLTSLALAALVGIFANAILPGKDYVFRGDNEAKLKTSSETIPTISDAELED